MRGDTTSKARPSVCTLGLWHLGTVVSACLAELGYPVVGYDRDAGRTADLNAAKPPLFEPGLAELLARNIEAGRLRFTADLVEAVEATEFILLTYDTPVTEKDEADLTEIFRTVTELAPHLKEGATLVVYSQVPAGSCEEMASLIRGAAPGLDFGVAYVPENLRLGKAIACFMAPDLIVIGADSETSLDKVESLLSVVSAPRVRTNLRTAEMIKHAINAFLATSISFSNEIANLCDEVGADALTLAEALRLDERIGQKLPLQPGLGFSGGTLARDLKALKRLGSRSGVRPHLIDAVLRVNQRQNGVIARKLKKVYGSLAGLEVGVLGLTYKAGTSTLRRSAALEIIRDLVSEGAVVRAHDPKVDRGQVDRQREFRFCDEPYSVAEGSDALVFVTEWPEFHDLDFARIRSLMRRPVLIDARNMFSDRPLAAMGFSYHGIGR